MCRLIWRLTATWIGLFLTSLIAHSKKKTMSKKKMGMIVHVRVHIYDARQTDIVLKMIHP
jgi:hypothetical protein